MSDNPQADRAIADVLASLERIIPEPYKAEIDSGFYVLTPGMRIDPAESERQAAESRRIFQERKQREQQAKLAMDAAWNAFIEETKKLLPIAASMRIDTNDNPLNKLRALSQADREKRDRVNDLATAAREWVYGLEINLLNPHEPAEASDQNDMAIKGNDAVDGGISPGQNGELGAGVWLMPPLSLMTLAERIGNGITPDRVKVLLKSYGLRTYPNRQFWTFRLDLVKKDNPSLWRSVTNTEEK